MPLGRKYRGWKEDQQSIAKEGDMGKKQGWSAQGVSRAI